jgi:transcriptional regulator with XRE-family HTH domain
MHEGNGSKAAAGGPIGLRLAVWRTRRGRTTADVAARSGLTPGRIADVESGRDWVDRRGPLAALTAAMRLDPSDLTGQPYAPAGDEHVAVRAITFHLRRTVADALPSQPLHEATATVDELAARTAQAPRGRPGGSGRRSRCASTSRCRRRGRCRR